MSAKQGVSPVINVSAGQTEESLPDDGEKMEPWKKRLFRKTRCTKKASDDFRADFRTLSGISQEDPSEPHPDTNTEHVSQPQQAQYSSQHPTPVIKNTQRKVIRPKEATKNMTFQSLPKKKDSKRKTHFAHNLDGPIDSDTLIPVTLSSSPPKRTSDARRALERDVGRIYLPTQIARNWVVEVSPAEWNSKENRWKYRVLVQRRQLAPPISTRSDPMVLHGASSFTTAFTWRSLGDFWWLENALKAEYHGALMLPLLSVALGTTDLANNTESEVEASLLRDWLGDILNGIRGGGEFVLDMDKVDLMASEAMEAFLYRHADPLPVMDKPGQTLNSSFDIDELSNKKNTENSFAQMCIKPFGTLDAICGLASSNTNKPETTKPLSRGIRLLMPLDVALCSSRAVSDAASLELNDSFADSSDQHRSSCKLAIHSELLEAEKELITSHKQTALSLMETLQVMMDEEILVGSAWKRFAIAIYNLFACEKEIEGTRMGEKEKKENMPNKKVSVITVDDCLRVMARHKMERATLSLELFSTMLHNYVGDLSAVEPAVDAYSEAVKYLARLDDLTISIDEEFNEEQTNGTICGTSGVQWQEQLRLLALPLLEQVRGTNPSTGSASLKTRSRAAAEQKYAFENRVLANEKLLKESVTALCKAHSLRASRMAWKYFKRESRQAALTNGAAISMRTKVNYASPKSKTEMASRHEIESKADKKQELDLVQRIVHLGDTKTKFVPSSGTEMGISFAAVENDGFANDGNDFDEEEHERLRNKALKMASERSGRWNAELSSAIMETVGIKNEEVTFEDTDRDLKKVRMHAMSLRENLDRCVEATSILKSSIFEGGHDAKGDDEYDDEHCILDTRRMFAKEMIALFGNSSSHLLPDKSYRSKSASPSKSILSSVGIDTTDSSGWNVEHDVYNNKNRQGKEQGREGRCGELAVSYGSKRDSRISFFLNQISECLVNYQGRLELLEGIVYMQCVGIQLEKHFSQKRTRALAAWEKKTDITTAINIATRKKLPALVTELQAKMDNLDPPNVSQTMVIELKDTHLVAKTLALELEGLSNRCFLRAREAATEGTIELMTLWARHEESSTNQENRDITDVVDEIARTLRDDDIPAYLLQHSK